MFLFPSCNCEKSKMKRLFVGVFTSELWPRPPSLPGRLPWGCSEGGPDPRLRDKGQRPRVSDRLEENGWTNPVPSPAGRRPCQGWRRAGGAAGLQPCVGSSAHAPPRTSRRGLCVVGCGREPHGHLSGPPSAPRPRLQHHRTRAAASGTQVPGGEGAVTSQSRPQTADHLDSYSVQSELSSFCYKTQSVCEYVLFKGCASFFLIPGNRKPTR